MTIANELCIDVSQLYDGEAKLEQLSRYETAVRDTKPEGRAVILTGHGPVWLYLRIAHLLHGLAKSLAYRSPVTGDVEVFNHDPF